MSETSMTDEQNSIKLGELTFPPRKVYIRTYGCQMNVADSEVVVSILNKHGFGLTDDYKDSDLTTKIPINTKTQITITTKIQ